MAEQNNIRRWLVPLSWLYGSGSWMMNKLYDLQIKKSVEFELPVISIGNLNTGGTGKTPHVEFLIRLLQERYQVGILSRGYKRKTKGYLLADQNSSAKEIGDEPLQIKRKFPEVMVAVCEERTIGIPIMLLDNPRLQVVILDDAFQHRQVKAGLSILLTDRSKLFTRDQLLPAGNLREKPTGVARADAIIVTKCSQDISSDERKKISDEVRVKAGQPVFFSSMEYDEPYLPFGQKIKLEINATTSILLVTGIASGENLLRELQTRGMNVHHLSYSDHHRYTNSEVKGMIQKAKEISNNKPVIITTEKDMTRLIQFRDLFLSEQVEIYCIPVRVKFIGQDDSKFSAMVLRFIEGKLKEQRNG